MRRRWMDSVCGPLGIAAAALLLAGCTAASSTTTPAVDVDPPEASAPAGAEQSPTDVLPAQVDSLPVVGSTTEGCALPNLALEPGTTTTRTLATDGTERAYLLHVPSGYQPGQPAPAVVVLHGMGANAFLQLANSGIVASANANGYVVIAPDGVGGTWQLPSSGTDQTSSPDVDFVTNVVDDAGSALCLDPSRQYASGFSMGSAMTLLLACQPDRRYAAFGGVGAAFYESACSQAPPAPLIYFHGTNDDVVPFEGGTARGFEVAPVPEVMASWATHNGCSTGPAETTTADVTLLGWSDCALNADVDFFRVAEGSHTWPGSPVTTNPVFADYAGVTTDTVNATDAMWEFFSGYQLPTQ